METDLIIAIGREFCSGGAEVGHKVAEYYDIPYYDKQIIDETADMLNVSRDIVKKHDERKTSLFDVAGFQYWDEWYADDPSLLMPMSLRVAEAQFKFIRKCADEGPCVIVGRCAERILNERDNLLKVFIHSDLLKRISRAIKLYELTESEAKKMIKQTDKIRSSYYKNYANKDWGNPNNYDLYIDSSQISTVEAANIIEEYIDRRQL